MNDDITVNYNRAVVEIANALANERGEDMRVTHVNDARRILWPCLSDEDKGRLVMR
jgi:hypothetical protein